jgi:integrase
VLPFVGYAKLAIEQARIQADDQWLFPQYIKAAHCYATHASNAVNKWLKKDFSGLTAHCLRHTFRDRLRALECPTDMIDQIGGWSSINSVGSFYGQGFNLEIVTKYVLRSCILGLGIENSTRVIIS